MGENLYKTTGTFIPDKLIAGNGIPVTTKGIEIAKGEGKLKRGTLMGLAADGKYKRTDTGENTNTGDGTDTEGSAGTGKVTDTGENTEAIGADCILTDDVDATDSEVVTTAYVTGTFNRAAIILPEGKSVDAHETELRKLGIFLRAVQD